MRTVMALADIPQPGLAQHHADLLSVVITNRPQWAYAAAVAERGFGAGPQNADLTEHGRTGCQAADPGA
jgi:hypothetical protein